MSEQQDAKPPEPNPAGARLLRQIDVYARIQWGFAIALLIAAAVFYLGVYRPQQKQIEQLTWEANNKRLELAADRSQTNRLPRETRELAALKQRLAGFKKLPTEAQLGDFLHAINQASQRAALQKLVIEPQVAQRDELFSEQPIELTFTGDFAAVARFISELEDMQRLTRLRELSIHCLDSHHGTVEVKLSVNIYYGETM